MGKDLKRKRHGNVNQKPYNKNGWKVRRTDGQKEARTWHTNKTEGKRQAFAPKVSLREDQVGITEFVNSSAGFTGVLKSRFSDFHVNEIDVNGKVLQLTDLNIPKPAEEGLDVEQLEAAQKELESIVATDWWAKLDALAAAKLDGDNDAAETIEMNVTELDKDTRTKIHKIIKQCYKKKLVSTTVNAENDQKKIIRVMKPKGGRNGQDRKTWGFPHEFVHFLVHKENMDTVEVAAAIAANLNLRSSQVTYSGTKDKRAKTTQKFCIKKRTPSQIVGSIKKVRNVYIGNFEFSNQVLKLGDLKGNRFRIALRHVKGDRKNMELRLEQLREHGFINYYGLQRFGNCASIPTYEIGVALLKSDYKLACELILKPRDNDVEFMREVREHWWKNRDAAAAAAMIYSKKYIEKMLLDGLATCGGNDYATALRKIPRNMLLLYPHAFQSLVCNRIASRRIKEFGLKLIPGDLVFKDQNACETELVELPTEDLDISNIDNTEAVEDDENNADTETTEVCEVPATTDSPFKNKVKALTAEDIASNNYTIFDVVLPLPGFDITYPQNQIAAWYEELLLEHNLTSEKLRHNIKTFAMAGAYRKLLIKPTEMTWEFRQYKLKDETLIGSDWETLKPNPQATINNDGAGEFTALLLDFCLTTSAYATMMLRELLKEDTSASKQTEIELNEQKKATPINSDNPEIVPLTK